MPSMASLVWMFLLSAYLLVSPSSTLDDYGFEGRERDEYSLLTGCCVKKELNVVHVEGQTSLVVRVRACNDAHVFLRDTADAKGGRMTDVWLGARRNTLAVIIGPGSYELASASSLALLHCSEFRAFWLAWNQTTISVGRGPVPGFQLLLNATWPHAQRHDVISATLSTGGGETGMWQLADDVGRGLSAVTPAETSQSAYTYLWRTVEHSPPALSFSVKSCDDVRVGLGTELGDAHYTVNFDMSGTNSSYISEGGQEIIKVGTSLREYCHYSGTLWVMWQDKYISAGVGLFPGNHEIMRAPIQGKRPVTVLGFASDGRAEWEFHQPAEQLYTFLATPSWMGFNANISLTWRNWLHASIVQSATFFVEQCEDEINIALIPKRDIDNPNNVTLHLGCLSFWDTGYVRVERNGQQEQRYGDMPCMVSCNITRAYWLRWGAGYVELGQGLWSGMRLLMKHPLRGVDAFHVVGFSSGRLHTAIWAVAPLTWDDVSVTSGNLGGASVPVLNDWTRKFHIKDDGSAMASVVLNDGTMGVKNVPHIVLTQMHTSYLHWVITYKDSDGLPQVKHCKNHDIWRAPIQKPMKYWISWRFGHLMFGLGDEVDETNTNLTCDDNVIPVPLHVRSMSLFSRGNCKWRLPAERGDELTLGESNTMRWLAMRELRRAIIFRIRGEGGLQLLLSPKYMIAEEAYVLTFTSTGIVATKGAMNHIISFGEGTTLTAEGYTDFWLRRVSGPKHDVLEVGRDDFGVYPLGLVNIDHGYGEFQGVGVLTGSNTFRVPVNRESELAVNTSTQSAHYGQVWKEVRYQNTVVFSINSCKSLSEILLSPQLMRRWDANTIRLVIDFNEVRLIQAGHVFISHTVHGLLACGEDRYFWLAWGEDGEINVGRGTKLGTDVILSWYALHPYTIQALGFSNGYQASGASWRIHLSPGTRFTTMDWAEHGKQGVSDGLSVGATVGLTLAVVFAVFVAFFVVVVQKEGLPAPLYSLWLRITARFERSPPHERMDEEAETASEGVEKVPPSEADITAVANENAQI